MTLEIPKFVFKNTGITQESFDAAESREFASFAAGKHDLVVAKSVYTGQSDKDSTWAKFRVVLAEPGVKVVQEGTKFHATKGDKKAATMNVFLMVPTDQVVYDLANSKRPTWAFAKLREFLAAIGTEISIDDHAEIGVLFGKNDGIVGRKITVEIGYGNKMRAEYRDGSYVAVDAKGEVMNINGETTFPNKENALGAIFAAGGTDKTVAKYGMDILKFYPGAKVVKAKSKPKKSEAAEAPADNWDE